MSVLGRVILLCWVPITFIIFVSKRPPRKALVFSIVVGWLLLPPGGLSIPGLPDYTKTFATSFGALLAVCAFDMHRLLSFRPKWYDVPMMVLCFGPIPTAINNDLKLYDGLSETFTAFVMYGIPYVLGRIYLRDRASLTAALASFVAMTLVYSIPALWEVRMSPQFQSYFYGTFNAGFHPPRFGLGYRPYVFMTTGLELGLWIAFAAIFAYSLMASRSQVMIWGIQMRWVTLYLIALSVLTKSVGAVVLMALGVVSLWSLRRAGGKAVLWVILVLPIMYLGLRMTGAWSGDNVVSLTETYLGPARASSLQTRFQNEDRLIAKALERPILGWGGYARSRVRDKTGRDITLTDGLWVIVLGTQGWAGLSGLLLTFLLPQFNLLRRTKGAALRLPEMQPVAATFIFCCILTVDSLLNSNPNPMYFMLVGGLAGFTGAGRESMSEEAESYASLGDALASEGSVEGAELAYRTSMQAHAARPEGDVTAMAGLAEGHESLGRLYEVAGREEEAELELRRAVAGWEKLAESHPSDVAIESSSEALGSLARFLKDRGREEEAEAFWRASISVLEKALADAPPGSSTWRAYADRHNDLAWMLALPAEPDRGDAASGALLAQRAATLFPDEPCFWNTLGVARFYAGDDHGAVEALTRSVELGDGGNGFDHYVLAMACFRLGERGVAHQWFLHGEYSVAAEAPGSADMARVRTQAEALLTDAEAAGPAALSPNE